MRVPILLVPLILVFGGCEGRGGRTTPAGSSVRSQEVVSIEVELEKVNRETVQVPRFTAAPDDHTRLLALVQGGRHEPDPKGWVVMGAMRIARSNRTTTAVTLYWTGDGSAGYRLGRSHLRGPTAEDLVRTVSECARRGVAKPR